MKVFSCSSPYFVVCQATSLASGGRSFTMSSNTKVSLSSCCPRNDLQHRISAFDSHSCRCSWCSRSSLPWNCSAWNRCRSTMSPRAFLLRWTVPARRFSTGMDSVASSTVVRFSRVLPAKKWREIRPCVTQVHSRVRTIRLMHATVPARLERRKGHAAVQLGLMRAHASPLFSMSIMARHARVNRIQRASHTTTPIFVHSVAVRLPSIAVHNYLARSTSGAARHPPMSHRVLVPIPRSTILWRRVMRVLLQDVPPPTDSGTAAVAILRPVAHSKCSSRGKAVPVSPGMNRWSSIPTSRQRATRTATMSAVTVPYSGGWRSVSRGT